MLNLAFCFQPWTFLSLSKFTSENFQHTVRCIITSKKWPDKLYKETRYAEKLGLWDFLSVKIPLAQVFSILVCMQHGP